jgi:biopolymer transport protein ExbB
MNWSDFLPRSADAWARALTFVPLVLCSIVGFALTLIKWSHARPPIFRQPDLFLQIGEAVKLGRLDAARDLAHRDQSSGGQLVETILAQAGRPRNVLKDRAEHTGQELGQSLERSLGGLALIATLGPLLGLLGTVVGIILIFSQLAATVGGATPQDLAGGIGTALYTTVVGLVIGILALVSHGYLANRIDRRIAQLEAVGLETVDLLAEAVPCISDPHAG